MIRLKELRISGNLTQTDVASVLGITQQAYANYERGAREADYSSLIKLSNLFEVSIDYLLGKTTQKKINPSSKEDELISTLDEETLIKLDELLHMVDELSEENFSKLMDYARLVVADQQRCEAT